jgi:hypothetical protein
LTATRTPKRPLDKFGDDLHAQRFVAGDVLGSYPVSNEASITVNQEGVKSLASALLNAQAYEIFTDDRKVGVLDGYQIHRSCSISPGPHSVYVRAFARSSVTITRVYGYSRTLDVNLSPGENKRLSCGLVKGPPLRRPLILTSALITLLLALGLGSIGNIPERTRYVAVMVIALITLACSWYGHSSTPGKSIYPKET